MKAFDLGCRMLNVYICVYLKIAVDGVGANLEIAVYVICYGNVPIMTCGFSFKSYGMSNYASCTFGFRYD